jgi:hypothetical protein
LDLTRLYQTMGVDSVDACDNDNDNELDSALLDVVLANIPFSDAQMRPQTRRMQSLILSVCHDW